MSYVALKVMSPKKIDRKVRQLIEYLELAKTPPVQLKFSKPIDFDAEMDNCHINVWVRCDLKGGSIQQGWIIAQDKKNNFVEAQFHSVWRSTEGKLIDVTPRKDGEKRIMFLPDDLRHIELSEHEGHPAIITYDNVRIKDGILITDLKK